MINTARRARLIWALRDAGPPRATTGDIVRECVWRHVREPASGRTYALLRVRTSSGLVGYGECGPVGQRDKDALAAALMQQDAGAYEVIRARLAAHPRVCAAANMALLDILGKRSGAPVYQLLGGPTRNKVRALASLEGAGDDALKRSLEDALREGHKAFSVPLPPPPAPNQGQAYVLAVRKRLEELRAAAGTGTDFVLDAGAGLTPGDAASLAAALERFRLLWLDEPCPLVNLGALRKISDETVTPVGYGRSVHQAAVFQDLLREGLVDVLRPDIALNGITRIRRMATLAETYYVAVAPFHSGGPIATAAAIHLAASLPNFFIQQLPPIGDPRDREVRAALTSGSIETVRNGFLSLLTGPGLGVQVDENAVARYATT